MNANDLPVSNAPLPSALRRGLTILQKRELGLLVSTGLAKTLAVFCAALLVNFLADRFLFLTMGGRLGLAIGVWTSAGLALFGWIVLPTRRRPTDEQTAFEVESKHPELEERLSSTVELLKKNEPAAYKGSPQLIEALRQQTIEKTASLDFAHVATGEQASRAWGMAAGFAVAVVAFLFLNGADPSLLLRRFVSPLTDLPKPSTVKFDVAPQNATVEMGANVDVIVRVQSGNARRAIVIARDKGGQRTVEMDRKENGDFRAILRGINAKTEYFVRAGDGQSAAYHLTPLLGPQIASFTFTLEYPAYTQWATATKQTTTGDLVAPIGTKVQLSVASDRPLATAEMMMGTQPLAMQIVEGKNATATFEVKHDSEYRLRLTDANKMNNSPQLAYRIKAMADQPPEITLNEPAADEIIAKPRPLTLAFDAKDDFGLAKIFLVTQLPNATAKRTMIQSPSVPTASARHKWNVAETTSDPEIEITYWLEAEDSLPARPNIARSKEYHVYVSQAADLALNSQEWKGWHQTFTALDTVAKSLAADLQAKQGGTDADKLGSQIQQTQSDIAKTRSLALEQFQQAERSQDARDFENVAGLLRDIASIHRSSNVDDLKRASEAGAALRDAFARMYDGRQIESLAQNARRITLNQQRLASQTRLLAGRTAERETAAELMARQRRIAANLDMLTQGFGVLAATLPENRDRLTMATGYLRQSINPIAVNATKILEATQFESAAAAQKSLLGDLSRLNENLAAVEKSTRDLSQQSRARVEASNGGFSAALAKLTAADQQQFNRTTEQESAAHRAARRGDKQWATDLDLAREEKEDRKVFIPVFGQMERQKEVRDLVRTVGEQAAEQSRLTATVTGTSSWQSWRFDQLADEQHDALTDWQQANLRIDALAVRMKANDAFAARDMEFIRSVIVKMNLPDKFETARQTISRREKVEAQAQTQVVATNLRHVHSLLNSLLKRDFVSAKANQEKPNRGEVANKIEDLAKREADLAKETAKADPQKAPELEQKQEQLRADTVKLAQEIDKQIRDAAPETPRETEAVRDLVDTRQALSQIEQGEMKQAERALEQQDLAKAQPQEQSAAQKLEELAKALEKAETADKLNDQIAQLDRLAEQQKQTQDQTQQLAKQNSKETAANAAQQEQVKQQAAEVGEELKQVAEGIKEATPKAAEQLDKANQQLQSAEKASTEKLQAQQPAQAVPEQSKALQAIDQAKNALQQAAAEAQKQQAEARAELRQNEEQSPQTAQEARNLEQLQKLQQQIEQQKQIRDQTEALQQQAPNAPQTAQQSQQVGQREQALSQEVEKDAAQSPETTPNQIAAEKAKLDAAAEAVKALQEQEKNLTQSLDNAQSQQQAERHQTAAEQENINRGIKELGKKLEKLNTDSPQALPESAEKQQPAASESGKQAADSLKSGDVPTARQSQKDASNQLSELARQATASKEQAERNAHQSDARQLDRIADNANELAQRQAALEKRLGEANSSQQADLSKQSQQQAQAANDLRELGRGLNETAQQLQEIAPQAAQEIGKAAGQAQEQIPPQLQRSAESINSPTLNDARNQQAPIERDLQALAQQIDKARGELGKAQQQAEDQAQQANAQSNLPSEAAKALSEAATQMKKAGQNLQRGDPNSAAQKMPAIEQKLAEAQQALQQASQQGAESRLAQAAQQPSKKPGQKPSQSQDSRAGKELDTPGDVMPVEGKPKGIGNVDLDWSRLPSKLKDELSQSLREGYPPEYEALIKQYYKQLSESAAKDSGAGK